MKYKFKRFFETLNGTIGFVSSTTMFWFIALFWWSFRVAALDIKANFGVLLSATLLLTMVTIIVADLFLSIIMSALVTWLYERECDDVWEKYKQSW